MRLGPRALALLHHFESCRLRAYQCQRGLWTIGWGTRFYPGGRQVQPGDEITQQEADEAFMAYLTAHAIPAVVRAIGNAPTTPAQFGAMVCLAYNIGPAAFAKSEVCRLHVEGKPAEASLAFRNWVRAGDKVSAGLIRRREAERLLYEGQLEALDQAIGYRP